MSVIFCWFCKKTFFFLLGTITNLQQPTPLPLFFNVGKRERSIFSKKKSVGGEETIGEILGEKLLHKGFFVQKEKN